MASDDWLFKQVIENKMGVNLLQLWITYMENIKQYATLKLQVLSSNKPFSKIQLN